ncbi:DUF4374 domain-containing protein [Flammeovirga agarivorans]|uniref:DUF4374 domain-containing protein n=1 Tax=Flammeovirga agarivorans TaxID=2726742 RepID=A0A7X8XTZ7_9BACT|nr:DUF4374 domain-containing protein [Flammeovirga agarivorans]NLR89853.1 DUF4374 domain-containing protein [Flammeovirga agarivorans]
MKNQLIKSILLGSALFSFASCEESSTTPTVETSYVVGIEAVSQIDVLLTAESLTEGEISPVGNGIEQPAWMSFYKAGNMVFAGGYSSDNIITAYNLQGENGGLVSSGQLVTDQGVYATTNIDDDTFIAVGAPREGFEERTVYFIDKNDVSISERKFTRIDERKDLDLVSFPTGVHQRGDKLFISYFLTGTGAVVPAFATPMADTAKIAVYEYPSMEFVKLIKDERTSEIGRYTSETAMQEDENGNIYTYSTSSLACGFLPTPTTPSGFLRINAGDTEFDDSYFFDFEAASGGYKINSAVYVGNGKMVVRVVMHDEVHWSTYSPNIAEEQAHLSYMIADLNTKEVTPVTGIPLTGGGWGFANLIKDGKVYVNISNDKGGHIYEINPETASATEGAMIVGHYAKGIFDLPIE